MPDIVFSDWNNYTDRDGSAQTLDWDNLPAFLDIGVGMTALVQAINERLKTIVDDVADLIELKQFYSLSDISIIDNKLNSLCQRYLNQDLTYAGNTNHLEQWTYLNIEVVLAKLGQTPIYSNAFNEISREWLKQRYDIINKLLWVDFSWSGSNSTNYIAQEIYQHVKTVTATTEAEGNTIEDDFNNAIWTKVTITEPRYQWHTWDFVGPFRKSLPQQIERRVIGWDVSNILTELKCTRHVFMMYERRPSHAGYASAFYQDRDTFNPQNQWNFWYSDDTPVLAATDFDGAYTQFENNSCVPTYQAGFPGGYRQGYSGNRLVFFINKFNVTGGFKFQP